MGNFIENIILGGKGEGGRGKGEGGRGKGEGGRGKGEGGRGRGKGEGKMRKEKGNYKRKREREPLLLLQDLNKHLYWGRERREKEER